MEQPRPHDTMYDAWVMTLDRIRPARVMRGRVMITDHCHRQALAGLVQVDVVRAARLQRLAGGGEIS